MDDILAAVIAEIRPLGVLTGGLLLVAYEKVVMPWIVRHEVPILRGRWHAPRNGR
jgi:hypothetical protein